MEGEEREKRAKMARRMGKGKKRKEEKVPSLGIRPKPREF
jgi:hypothetical protein